DGRRTSLRRYGVRAGPSARSERHGGEAEPLRADIDKEGCRCGPGVLVSDRPAQGAVLFVGDEAREVELHGELEIREPVGNGDSDTRDGEGHRARRPVGTGDLLLRVELW